MQVPFLTPLPLTGQGVCFLGKWVPLPHSRSVCEPATSPPVLSGFLPQANRKSLTSREGAEGAARQGCLPPGLWSGQEAVCLLGPGEGDGELGGDPQAPRSGRGHS